MWSYSCALGGEATLERTVYAGGCCSDDACRCTVELSRGRKLKHQGIEVSHTTLHEKVREWSAGESVSDYVAKESLDVGARWYVSCDGCHTNSRVGWQEKSAASHHYPHQNATSVMFPPKFPDKL